MKIEDLVITDKDFLERENIWDEDYQKMYGGKMIPQLSDYSTLVSNILSVMLINGNRTDVNRFEYGIWEQVADGAYFRQAVSSSANISNNPQLECVESYLGNLAFFNDLRIYFSDNRFFIKAKRGTISLSLNDFNLNEKQFKILNENEIIAEIITRTGSKNVRIAFPWIREIVIANIQEEKTNPVNLKYDIFLSHKSQDYQLAKILYDYLIGNGFTVFLSEICLPKVGSAEYMKQIDAALDTSDHMILIGSSVNNLLSSWVEAEWRVFINEKRSGRKTGNFLTVVSNNIEPADLPISIRYYEVMPFEKDNLQRVLQYFKKD